MKHYNMNEIFNKLNELGFVKTKQLSTGIADKINTELLREIVKPKFISMVRYYLKFTDSGLSAGDVVRSKLDNQFYIVRHQLFSAEREEFTRIEVVNDKGEYLILKQNEFEIVARRAESK